MNVAGVHVGYPIVEGYQHRRVRAGVGVEHGCYLITELIAIWIIDAARNHQVVACYRGSALPGRSGMTISVEMEVTCSSTVG